MNKETLEEIEELQYNIIEDIKKISSLLTSEVLEYAKNEKTFWRGHIGHIKRRVELYAQTIPSFELLESELVEEDEEEVVSKVVETTKTVLSSIEQSFLEPEPILHPDLTKEEWIESTKFQALRFKETLDKYKFGYDVFVDEEIVDLVQGFMCGPVGIFRNKPIEANIVQKYDNIHELKIFLKLQAKTKDVVLYMTFKDNDKYCFRGQLVDRV